MSLKFKNLKRGFTLVELMIVVAIIGILAALAVYGVSKYLKSAKTTEAREGIGRIAKDAVASFDRESMSGAVLGAGDETGITHRLCDSADAVPPDVPAASKYQSRPSDWTSGSASAGWKCLKFTMNAPQYFQYDYNRTGNGMDANSTFSAVAAGDLDGDGESSTFTLRGAIQNEDDKLQATHAPAIDEVDPEE